MKTPRNLVKFTALGLLAVSGAAVAATATDSVSLAGVVAPYTHLTATDLGAAATLDLGGVNSTPTVRIVKVASLVMASNSAEGLTLDVTGGDIVHSSDATQKVAYTVSTVADGAAAPADASGWTTTHDYTRGQGIENRDLYISFTTKAFLEPGNYAGTVSLTVTDNS